GMDCPRHAGPWLRRAATEHFLWRAIGRASRLASAARAAAVLGQIRDQAVHRPEIGAVMDEPTLLPRADEPGVCQLLQVERQCRGRHVELLCNAAGCEPGGPLLDEQPEQRQSCLL